MEKKIILEGFQFFNKKTLSELIYLYKILLYYVLFIAKNKKYRFLFNVNVKSSLCIHLKLTRMKQKKKKTSNTRLLESFPPFGAMLIS